MDGNVIVYREMEIRDWVGEEGVEARAHLRGEGFRSDGERGGGVKVGISVDVSGGGGGGRDHARVSRDIEVVAVRVVVGIGSRRG